MKSKKEQGYTMIIVMCLMFLFMALALSMLFSSAQLLARAEQAAAQKQSRASAMSFAECMDEWLTEGVVYNQDGSYADTLNGNIRKRFDKKTWPAYTGGSGSGAAAAILTFRPKSRGTSDISQLGDIEVQMYWETADGGTDWEDPDVDLVVTVKAVKKKEQFSVTTRYSKKLESNAEGIDEWDGKWVVGGRE